ncbi:hypothetical protein GCM10007096_09630 [Pullulanibacillus pueri]|uniref:Uncharacterized protein n=1 Tax=Pullulanibacillus pueri TaxID=1437324 RepID=A0A8J3EL50_9BACL|nr:hypothetical protein GCM10007096_09630 [Pullulanibacillus pueri]
MENDDTVLLKDSPLYKDASSKNTIYPSLKAQNHQQTLTIKRMIIEGLPIFIFLLGLCILVGYFLIL